MPGTRAFSMQPSCGPGRSIEAPSTPSFPGASEQPHPSQEGDPSLRSLPWARVAGSRPCELTSFGLTRFHDPAESRLPQEAARCCLSLLCRCSFQDRVTCLLCPGPRKEFSPVFPLLYLGGGGIPLSAVPVPRGVGRE